MRSWNLPLSLHAPLVTLQGAAKEIAAAVEKGKLTEIEINVARELYRKQATEGAMLYFLLTKLWVAIRGNIAPVMLPPNLKQAIVLELGNLNSIAVFVESIQAPR